MLPDVSSWNIFLTPCKGASGATRGVVFSMTGGPGMKALSTAVANVSRSPIRAIFDAAAAVPDAISLALGQPDFSIPMHVAQSAADACFNEYTGYTSNAGIVELRQAICKKLARENDIHVGPENIIVTSGAMQSIHLSMSALLSPGDDILLPNPGYGNFVMAAKLCYANPIEYPTPPELDFEPDFDALEELITPRTKAMLINSPSNPTGAVWGPEIMKACLEFCQRHDIYMISDETYDRLVYEGEHVSPAIWDTEGRVLTIFTLSKTYSMTGWRVGWTVASEEIITAMTVCQEPVVSCINTVAQHAAIAALEGPQDCVVEMVADYRRRRDVAVETAKKLGLDFYYPHGAFYLLINIRESDLTSVPFSESLLQTEHVAVAPGAGFGSMCDDYVRISLCAAEEDVIKGIERIARHMDRAV